MEETASLILGSYSLKCFLGTQLVLFTDAFSTWHPMSTYGIRLGDLLYLKTYDSLRLGTFFRGTENGVRETSLPVVCSFIPSLSLINRCYIFLHSVSKIC